MAPLLEVTNLTVEFPRTGGWVPVVQELSFSLGEDEFLGLVGESGSGKSLTALAVLGLVPEPGRITSGSVRFDGQELVGMPERELRKLRGAAIAMVFQEPTTALNPVLTIGFQIAEAIRVHQPVSRRQARAEAAELLAKVAIPEPGRRLHDYPHQLSGGQRQRAMIAMALAARPRLLLADEPTTALDVTIQAQILELLERLREELGLAVLLISHDLAVIAETCGRVLVMYAGRLVEEAPVAELFASPAHPYTRGLLAALPRLGKPAARGELTTIPGQVPGPSHLPPGCSFHPRCRDVMPVCKIEAPPRLDLGKDRRARCWLYREGGPP